MTMALMIVSFSHHSVLYDKVHQNYEDYDLGLVALIAAKVTRLLVFTNSNFTSWELLVYCCLYSFVCGFSVLIF